MFEKEFDQWIDSYCKLFPFSGSVCVTSKNNIIYRRNIGLSNRELNVPIDNNTRFRFYSLTKPFTALGLLHLYEMGKVSLDVHPGKYISEAAYIHPDITIRSLMDHSHGLPDFFRTLHFSVLSRKYPVEDKAMLGSIKNLPMDFEPGTSVNYTNIGFYLISMIIEAVSGMKFCDYMEREVFEPLGMKNTCIDSAYRLILNRAAGYDIDGSNIIAAPYQCMDWLKGAGSAVGTVDDVFCLHTAARDKSYLKPETWKLVFSPNKGGFGLGCSVSRWHGKLRYTHNGGHLGFRTLHIQLPEDDMGIILLSNMGFGNARNAFSEAIYSIFYEMNEENKEFVEMDKGFARSGEVVYPVLIPQRPALYHCELGTYVGEYKNGLEHVFVDTEEINGVSGLRITYQDKRNLAIYPIAPGKFFNRTIDESYDFSKNKEGDIIFGGMIKRKA